jgi:hypothetical protein
LSAVRSALRETASGASSTKCRSAEVGAICLNNGSETRVFSGSNCFCRIVYHWCCGPYHARLPGWMLVLLMYIHRFLFIGVVVVGICFVGAGVLLAIGLYCYLLYVVVVYVGSIVFYCVGYWEGLVGFVCVCGY